MMTRRQLLACAAAAGACSLARAATRHSPTASAWPSARRALLVQPRPRGEGRTPYTVAVLALGPMAATAADRLLATGIDELLVRELGPSSPGSHPLCIVLAGPDALCRGEPARALAAASRLGEQIIVLADEADAFALAAAVRGGATAPTIVRCESSPARFADFVKSICSPGLRPGYVGFDAADLDALIGAGRSARFARWPIGDWTHPRCDKAAVAGLVEPPAAGLLFSGILLTIFTDSRDPAFTLQALNEWVCWLQGEVDPEAEIVFTVHDDPAAPHALITSFFRPDL